MKSKIKHRTVAEAVKATMPRIHAPTQTIEPKRNKLRDKIAKREFKRGDF
jgi:hypothetical protein